MDAVQPYVIIQSMNSEHIGRYQIQSRIGNGGMATVYLAYDPHFSRQVAIKVIPDHYLNEPQSHKRFQREAKAIAQLEHPAIVPVYDYGENKGRPYLVMRYMVGGSLKDWLTQDLLPLTTISPIIERIASALDTAHAKGLIHRDIKPSNILLDDQGNAYLSDFGIVKFSSTITATTGSALIGTPAYMSPEQIHGDRPIDHRTDIYALGIMMFEMLTGKRPFAADTPAKQMMAHALTPVPNILQYNAKLPTGIADIISKAMSKDPESRYDTAGELARELRQVINQSSMSLPVSSQTTATTTIKKKRDWRHDSRWLGIIIIIFFLVTLLIVFNNYTSNAALLLRQEPTATTTTAPTITPSRTSVPIPTSQPIEVMVPTPILPPTSSYEIISLAESSLLETPEANLGLLPNPQRLADIPFEPGLKISTQCQHDTEKYQTSISISTYIEEPRQIHILIQAGNGNVDFNGNTIGKITLYFDNGQRFVEPLVLGHNIRDWRLNLPDFYVNTISSYDIQEVWRGKTTDGIDGHIDLLTIKIPKELHETTLNNIEVTDTSLATVGSQDPCIHLIAITAESNS